MSESLIWASWCIDGSTKEVFSDVVIEIDGDTIRKIETGALPPKETTFVNLEGHTIIPALIDAHTHLFMSSTSDLNVRKKQLDSTYEELSETLKKHAQTYISHGIFALRDGGDSGDFSLRFRDECPRPSKDFPLVIRSPGGAFKAPSRYGKLISRPVRENLTLAEAIRDAHDDVDHIKIVQSGLNSLTRFGRITKPQFSLDELRAGVQAARERNLNVMVHANGAQAVESAIQTGCASIEHGFFMGKHALELLADSSCVWVPTAVTMKGYSENLSADDPRGQVARQNLDHQLDQIEQAKNLGVRIACGTDAGTLGVPHGQSLSQELELLMESGFSVVEAISSATSIPAKLLNLSSEFGEIGEAKPATFLAYQCSPKELIPNQICNPEQAWFRGQVAIA